MSGVVLRPYQDKLVTDIRAAFASHRRVLAVAPTGAGKTATFAYIATATAKKGNSVVIVAHRAEIVEQIGIALDRMGVRHGCIQPGRTRTADPVQVAMIQTLARRLDKIPQPSLLVVDEAHHGVAGSWAMVTKEWTKAKILGVTAVPRRLDGKGLAAAFDEMLIGPSMADLIRDGFLAGYDYLAPPQKADLSNVRMAMGDFAISEVAEIMDKQAITGDAVSHYRKHLGGRPAIAFCVTVAHAEHVAQQFSEAGFRAASVDGAMDKAERRRRIEAIGNGSLQILTSCELISEGVDVPVVAGAILLRPTKSLGMHLQQCGRVLRPKPDGSRAVILDHVGNVHNHGMPCASREWSLAIKPKKSTPAPMATCKACFQVFAVSPGWKDDHAACDDEPDCVFAGSTAEKKPPEQIAGELEAVTTSPEWSRGISLTGAKGQDWFRLLRLADTIEKLREIGIARGYKASWAWTMQNNRRQRVAAPPDADMPFAPDPSPAPRAPAFSPPPRVRVEAMFDDVIEA